MLPAVLGMLAGGAMFGMSAIQGMAPSASNAIGACLTDDLTAAQQRVFSNNPIKELDPSVLVQARLRNLISHDSYKVGLSKGGLSSNRSDVLLEASRHLLSLENLANSYFKGDISKDTYHKKAGKLGFTSDEVDLFLISYRSIPSAENLILNLWRGNINKDTYYKKIQGLGFTREDADLLIQAQYFIPSHEDLIRFQVRDVYNDNIVNKYGYDEEFPENILPDAAKIGMGRDTMMKYWKAHWDLPSPTQLYNMLQRLHPDVMSILGDKYQKMGLNKSDLYTDIDTAKEMLKIADYPKYWRDRLIAISYDPITRVDLRRIYQLGLCSDEFVVGTLMEHGYTKDDADLLLKFYQDLKHGKDKKLSTAALMKGYNYGLIKRPELEEALKDLNYNETDIRVMIETNNKVLEEKDFKELLEVWKSEYIRGTLSEDDIRVKLGLKGLSSTKIDLILTKFKQANRKTIKIPPLTDLAKFYKKGLLTVEDYKNSLRDSGIPERYLDYYVQVNQGID